jgi:flagellar hook-basal body complex protein FliE
MSADALSAARAYAQALQSPGGREGGDGVAGTGFSEVLQNAISQTIQTGRQADAAMTQAAVGKAELVDVVTAIAAAEVALETMVSVRDSAIQAYQEIMRMPI